MLSGLLDFVLAPICLACNRGIDPGDRARLVCRRCRTLLRDPPVPACPRCAAPLLRTGRTITDTCPNCERWPAALRFARSACLLYPPATEIVHQFKYGGWPALAGPMAERLARLPLPAGIAPIVIPVPTTAWRIRERGYNQAGKLARAYAPLMKFTVLDCLERTRATETQVSLQPLARAANVAGAFRIAKNADVKRLRGQHVLLIDDVLTTGATTAECASVLAAGGARAVTVLTFARALDARRLLGR